jgi:hypothetical protein
MGDRRGAYRILVGKHEGKNHLEYRGVNGSIILKCVFKNWDKGYEFIWLRTGTGGGLWLMR